VEQSPLPVPQQLQARGRDIKIASKVRQRIAPAPDVTTYAHVKISVRRCIQGAAQVVDWLQNIPRKKCGNGQTCEDATHHQLNGRPRRMYTMECVNARLMRRNEKGWHLIGGGSIKSPRCPARAGQRLT
jgi:hypothetical protein